jgi:hypothetical protein
MGYATMRYSNGDGNTGVGYNTLLNLDGGTYNTALGTSADIHRATPDLNNIINIGNSTFLNVAHNRAYFGGSGTTWIGGNVTWLTYSDARIKNNIQEDVKGLEFITRLRPVTYNRSYKAMLELTGNKDIADYPGKYDIEKIKFSGFLAQVVKRLPAMQTTTSMGLYVQRIVITCIP